MNYIQTNIEKNIFLNSNQPTKGSSNSKEN